jgi:hypothetical protein
VRGAVLGLASYLQGLFGRAARESATGRDALGSSVAAQLLVS